MGYEIPKLIAQSSSAAYTPLKDMVSYFMDKAKYVEELEDNLTKLTVQMTTLYSRKNQIDRILETSVFKEESDEYHILLKQIEVFSKKYDKFIAKYGKYCGNIPSVMPESDASAASNMIDVLQDKRPTIQTRKFFKLAKLSEHVKVLHDYISQVLDKAKEEYLVLEKKPQVVQVKHDDGDLPSLNEYVNKVLRYLCEDENRSIGIVGGIGVGKTTIIKRLNNWLERNTSLKLDVVIWINYPKERGTKEKIVEMVQDMIMTRLKLNREKTNNAEQNADIISMALSQKKYIVLLDQVSSFIDLDEVGIHKGHKFGKVVVASHNNKVIRQMTDLEVEINALSNDDAWNLFQNVCGVVHDCRIRDIADRIIKECGGLPLVIKLVAKHLKGEKDEKVWSEVKRNLQSETETANFLNLAGVANAYKLVYDGLDSCVKKCSHFGALFPSNHKIYTDYLVECWMAEGFLPLLKIEVRKLRNARDCGATILRELTDKYLLERCADNKYVKMPWYFRKVVLKQQYPDKENCVIWEPDDNKLLNDEIWRTITRMSLISCKPKLPECPESHNISTLLLQCNPELVTLGERFFLNMENLRVLDLNQTKIEWLPASISSLVNLISLYLNDCARLSKLPQEVKMLKKIEFLDIRRTSIPNLPPEISDMTRLRCLRVSFAPQECCRNSKGKEVEVMIPPNIIGRLQQLEELIIETGCCNPNWNNIAGEIALELATLETLTTLSFHFPDVNSLEKFVTNSKSWRNTETHWKNNTFKSFKFSVGCCETQHPYNSEITGILAERQLRFSANEEISSVKEVLKQASAFELVGHDVKSLSEFSLENAGALKVCVIERCNHLLNVVDVDKTNDRGVLQWLEKLHLFDLQLLRCIWKGPVLSGSLSNLKILTICGCHRLTWILNHELAKALPILEHLKVESCSEVVEIVSGQEHAPVSNIEIVSVQEHAPFFDILTKVKTIELVNLPNLESICKNGSITWNSVRKIVIKSCRNLRNLSSTMSNEEMLETIRCEASWWTGLQLSEEEKQRFLPLCDFIVVEEGSSSVRGSVTIQESHNNDSSQICCSEKGHYEAMTSNDSSKADVDRGAEKIKDKSLNKAKFVKFQW